MKHNKKRVKNLSVLKFKRKNLNYKKIEENFEYMRTIAENKYLKMLIFTLNGANCQDSFLVCSIL